MAITLYATILHSIPSRFGEALTFPLWTLKTLLDPSVHICRMQAPVVCMVFQVLQCENSLHNDGFVHRPFFPLPMSSHRGLTAWKLHQAKTYWIDLIKWRPQHGQGPGGSTSDNLSDSSGAVRRMSGSHPSLTFCWSTSSSALSASVCLFCMGWAVPRLLGEHVPRQLHIWSPRVHCRMVVRTWGLGFGFGNKLPYSIANCPLPQISHSETICKLYKSKSQVLAIRPLGGWTLEVLSNRENGYTAKYQRSLWINLSLFGLGITSDAVRNLRGYQWDEGTIIANMMLLSRPCTDLYLACHPSFTMETTHSWKLLKSRTEVFEVFFHQFL